MKLPKLDFIDSGIYIGIAMIALLLSTIPVLAGGFVFAQIAPLTDPTGSLASDNDSDEVLASSGSNRFVTWEDSAPGNNEIFLRRSLDNGATWEPRVNLSNNPGSSELPRIAVSGANVYIIWTQWNVGQSSVDIFLRRSTDNGATWKPSVNLSSNEGGSISPQIAVSGSNVFVIWVDSTNTFNGVDVFFKRSLNNGETWATTINISKNPGDVENQPQIALAGSNVYIVWEDYNFSKYDIFFKRSTDNGATWKTTLNLSNNPAESLSPRITASDSNVYVAWGDDTAATGNMQFRRSDDNGATWKQKIALTNNPDYHYTKDLQLTTSDVNVYVVWRTEQPPDILLRRSTDNGATWKPVVNLSNGLAENPQIAVSGSKVFVVWDSDTDQILLRMSLDNGATWKAVKTMSYSNNRVGNPDIMISGSNVYVAWQQGDRTKVGEIFVRYSTNLGASWESLKKLTNNTISSDFPQIGA